MAVLQGKRALVTGAGRGIGAAIARQWCEHGARVVLTDIDPASLESEYFALKRSGHDVIMMVHDVTDEEQWAVAVKLVENHFGGLDIFVNNAGISMFGQVTDLTTQQWRKCIAIDLDSVFFGTRAALPLMRRGGGGSIVNISSMAGIAGQPNLSAYCAAKGGVRMFSKAVALECAALRDGVRVNSVHPGIIKTPIFDDVAADAAIGLGRVGEAESIDVDALAAAVTPLGVAGRPDDVAGAVVYLASDAARFVTGTELVVDGGFCAA